DWEKRYPWLQEKKDPSRDLTGPAHLLFSWSCGDPYGTMKLEISEAPDFSAPADVTKGRIFQSAESGAYYADVANFRSGTRYYWRVVRGEGNSGVRSFVTEEGPRPIMIPGCANVRDIGGVRSGGGKKIKQGLVYRGSACDANDQEQYKITDDGMRVFAEDLGIKTEVDLRGDVGPSPFEDVDKVSAIKIFFHSYDWAHCDEEGRAGLRSLFEVLSDPGNYPLYIHCQAGADRAGTAIMYLEAVLGMGRDYIVRDYNISSLSVDDQRNFSKNEAVKDLLELFERDYPGLTFPDALVRSLLDAGVTEEQISAVRSFLLE
ncbi:MAG: tyrosine-protein phosphatase, partial [Clostridia bacterium]|nr:tyrosine-protein phosphatase [Clostridia bacterium]